MTQITGPHRSNVFRSQPTNRPAVAFSVPIRSGGEGPSELLGVLVMEAELGHFAEFQGTRNQLAVLVDLRQDEAGRPGLIVEHPAFDEQLKKQIPLDEYYVDSGTWERLNKIREQQWRYVRNSPGLSESDRQHADPTTPQSPTLERYSDPISDASLGTWLAATEPVFVARGGGAVFDTDWAVLVQERRSETLQPLVRVRNMILYGGLAALVLVVLIIASLWGLVALVVKAPGRLRGLPFWGRPLTTTAHGTSSAGSVSQRGTNPEPAAAVRAKE